MKKLLILFGILDVVTLIRDYKIVTALFSDLTYYPILVSGNILIYSSLIFSAYFLIRENKIGLWLTYAQFPLRLLYLTLSFGFLLTASGYFQQGELGDRVFLATLVGFEIVRLIITILIHRKYFRRAMVPALN